MKTLFRILALIIIAQSVLAQCCGAPTKHGQLYLEPLAKVSTIQGSSAFYLGGKLGWKVTEHWSLGWAANALINNNAPQRLSENIFADRLEMTYTGGVLGYSNSRVNRLSFGFDLLFGAGWLELDSRGEESADFTQDEGTGGTDQFMIVEPTAYVTFRYTPHFSLNTGIGTLLANGIERWGYTDADFYKVIWTFGVRVE